MKVTVNIELQESEAQYGLQVSSLLAPIAETVVTRVVTDKATLSSLLRDAATNNRPDTIISELSRRLSRPELYADCLEVLASLLFDPPKSDHASPTSSVVLTYVVSISRLPDAAVRTKVRDDLVSLALKHLLVPRPLEAPRDTLLPYCDALAHLVKFELVTARAAVNAVVQLVKVDRTRSAGFTLLGKLVETCCEALRRCEKNVLDQLRQVLSIAQEDVFMYDIEYVSEPLGWSPGQHHRQLILHRTCRPQSTPANSAPAGLVSSLSFAPQGGQRDTIVAATVDGAVTSYDSATASHLQTIPFPNHTPVALDVSGRRVLAVTAMPKSASSSPVIKFYSDDPSSHRWTEMSAPIEKDHLKCITALKWTRSGMHYATGETTLSQDTFLRAFDVSRGVQVNEYSNHSDMITALYTSMERDTIVLSGSRDKSVLHYDLRTQNVQAIAQLGSTVTTITGEGEYIVAGSLDRRLTLHDLRMPMSVLAQRDFESPVISASLGHKGVCAVGAMTGLFLVNLNIPTMPSSKAEGSGGNRYHCVSWNATQTLVYAGRDGGAIDVFLRPHENG